MQIRRCYPLSIRASWSDYDSFEMENDTTERDVMYHAWQTYCYSTQDDVIRVAHIQVRFYEPMFGTYRINHDGSYKKISDKLLELEECIKLK